MSTKPALLFLVMIMTQPCRKNKVIKPGHQTSSRALIYFMLSLLLVISPWHQTLANDLPDASPHWSLEVKLGSFEPAPDQWEDFYGDKRITIGGGALAYKVLRTLEIGLEAHYVWDRGTGQLIQNQQQGGSVTYQAYPLGLYAVFRMIFNENQWLVPYVGGGASRIYYEQSIKGQDSIKGSVDGHYFKGGLQLLLDRFEINRALSVAREFGLDNSYFFLEIQSITAEENSTTDLGGQLILGGFLFEF